MDALLLDAETAEALVFHQAIGLAVFAFMEFACVAHEIDALAWFRLLACKRPRPIRIPYEGSRTNRNQNARVSGLGRDFYLIGSEEEIRRAMRLL